MGAPCEVCTAERVKPDDFGVARLLVEAGVDRYALPGRVAAMRPGERGGLASRFEAQWGALTGRREEARFVVAALALHEHLERIERALLAALPARPDGLAALAGGPAAPFDDEARLDEIAADSPLPEIRELAQLARLRVGRGDRSALALAHGLAQGQDGRAVEASLALGRWFLARPGPGRVSPELAAAIEARLGDPKAATELAARLVAAGRDPGEPAIAAALEHAAQVHDPDTRLGVALALDDRAELTAQWTQGGSEVEGPPGRARRALAALARRRDPAALAVLEGGPEAAQRVVLDTLGAPIEGSWLAATLAIARGERALADRAQRRLFSGAPWAGWPEAERAQIAEAAPAGAHLGFALAAYRWVLDGDEAPAARAPFERGVTRALAASGAEAARAVIEAGSVELERWLDQAQGPEVDTLLEGWAAERDLFEPLARCLLDAEYRRDGAQAGYAADRLLGLFARAPGEGPAQALGRALRSGRRDRDRVLDGLLQLWIDAPARRRDVALATRDHRDAMRARRRARRLGPLDPSHPAAWFGALAGADPEDAAGLLGELLELSPEAAGDLGLLAAVFDHAEGALGTTPQSALGAAGRLASALVDRRRDGALEAEHTCLALRARSAALLAAARDTPQVEAERGELERALERLDRHEAKIAERAAGARARTEAEAARQAERRGREAEREAHEAAREAEAKAARQLAATLAARRYVPGCAPDPLDRAPRLPGTALPCLLDYVAFLKLLSEEVDALALMRARGLDPTSWTTQVEAWSAELQRDPALAMRFGALLSAPWRALEV